MFTCLVHLQFFLSLRSNCSGFLFGKLRLKVGVGVRLNKVSIETNNTDNMNWLVALSL